MEFKKRERRKRPAMEGDMVIGIVSMRSTSSLGFPVASSPAELSHSWLPSSSPPPSQEPALKAPPVPSTVDSEMMETLEQVQRIIGYCFHDLSLLEEALTHSSYAGRASYQRLEFLGDAVLNLAFTNFVFLTNRAVGPGTLSVLRSANISTEKLARVAIRHDFYRYLRRNCPSLDSMVMEFTHAVSIESEEECGDLSYGGSSVKAPKVLADIVESIAAAVYADCKFDLVELWKVFRGLLEPIITAETLNEQPVTHIYELCQKQGMPIQFKNWRKDNRNITNVFIDGELCGVGSSEQKHIAKLNAAREALQKMFPDECNSMENFECFHANGMLEDRGASKRLNHGVVRKTLANGIEEADGSKQKLHELCSKKHWQRPIYSLEKKQGPAHDRRFACSVTVYADMETLLAYGDPKSRMKEAENSAAYKLLCQIRAC